MSTELTAELAAAVRAHPGVADVACVVRKEARTAVTEHAPTEPEVGPVSLPKAGNALIGTQEGGRDASTRDRALPG